MTTEAHSLVRATMADVVAEMAGSMFENPMSGGPDANDTEDTDAVVLPDLFERTRSLFSTGAPSYRPRSLQQGAMCTKRGRDCARASGDGGFQC